MVGGEPARPLDAGGRDPDLDRGGERIADRRPAESALEDVGLVDRLRNERVIGRRRRRLLGHAGEEDEPDPHALRHAVEEDVDRLLRRREPGRLHVVRLH